MALLEGQKGVNWGVLMKVLFGFLFTTFCCCGLAALIFSQGIYCPSFYEVLSRNNSTFVTEEFSKNFPMYWIFFLRSSAIYGSFFG